MSKAIKILYAVDPHQTGVSPLRRKDDFPAVAAAKLEYFIDYGEQIGVDAYVFSGDLFEIPIVASSVVSRTNDIISKNDIPKFTIVGNHDVVGNNSINIDNTSLGTIVSSRILSRLSSEPTYVGSDYHRVALYGVDVHRDMDNLSGKEYFIKKDITASHTILVAHGLIYPEKSEIMKTTTFSEIIEAGTEADIILSGHDHKGYGVVEYSTQHNKKVIFNNPGSLVRCKAAVYEIERKVGFSLLELSPCGETKITFIQLPPEICKNGEDVLDRESLLQEQAEEEANIRMSIKLSDFSFSNVRDPRALIHNIMEEENISDDAKEELLARIASAEEILLAKRQANL